MQRHPHIHPRLPTRGQAQVPSESPRRVAEWIAHRACGRDFSLPQMLAELPSVERRGPERRRQARRDYAPGAVHDRGVAVPGDLADRGDASRLIEKLRGRVHLEGPKGQEELGAPGLATIVDEI